MLMPSVRTLCLFLCLSLTVACSERRPTGLSEHEVAYRHAGLGQTVEVFDLQERHFGVESAGYLRGERDPDSDIGGRIAVCSSPQYYCIRGGIRVAIPRRYSTREWAWDEMACSSEQPFSDREATITCSSLGKTTRLGYSLRRGIIWYERSSSPGDRYTVVGEKGLFAAGSNSPEHGSEN